MCASRENAMGEANVADGRHPTTVMGGARRPILEVERRGDRARVAERGG